MSNKCVKDKYFKKIKCRKRLLSKCLISNFIYIVNSIIHFGSIFIFLLDWIPIFIKEN